MAPVGPSRSRPRLTAALNVADGARAPVSLPLETGKFARMPGAPLHAQDNWDRHWTFPLSTLWREPAGRRPTRATGLLVLAAGRPPGGGRRRRGGGVGWPDAPRPVLRLRGPEPAGGPECAYPPGARSCRAPVRGGDLPGVMGASAGVRAAASRNPWWSGPSRPARSCWRCCSSTGITSSETAIPNAVTTRCGGNHEDVSTDRALRQFRRKRDDHSGCHRRRPFTRHARDLRRYLDMADGIEVMGEASNGKETARSKSGPRSPRSRSWTSGCPRWTGWRRRASCATSIRKWA